MTCVTVRRRSRQIVTVICDGHTDFGVRGEDIVCAALSSIVQTALLGLLQVAGIAVQYRRNDRRGYLEFDLPPLIGDDRHNASLILDTMLCGVQDLALEYSDYIDLIVEEI